MKLTDLVNACQLTVLTGDDQLDREIDGCYIGDLLSWAMGKVKENNVWITVMGNINAIAVAVLGDAACIVLVDNAPLDEAAKAKAEQQDVVVLSTSRSAFEVAAQVAEMF